MEQEELKDENVQFARWEVWHGRTSLLWAYRYFHK
jgi:hypothetical protein